MHGIQYYVAILNKLIEAVLEIIVKKGKIARAK